MADHPTVTDAFDAPLGQTPRKPRRGVVQRAAARIAFVTLAAIVLGFAGWTALYDDPLGGEPVAVVAAKAPPKPATAGGDGAAAAQAPLPPADGPPQQASGQDVQTVTIIDGMSGKRQQVIIAPPAQGATSAPPAEPAQATAAPAAPKLTETTRHGPVPRIGADGVRPSDAHAGKHPADAARGPRIAIVVGRLGLSASATTEALAKLPVQTTLAFSPYATDLERWTTRARSEGRELLLQTPMEPFDYPDNDPGPQTLVTALAPEQNLDRLHWAMSRFKGYVGLTNHMGARFLANEQATATLMQEMAKRGLIYVDDGAAPRSLASQIASGHSVPFAKADVVIDRTPAAGEIDAALTRLEGLARERGSAVGYAAALPVSIDRIAKWAKAAERRGVVLVPVTAVVSKPPST